MPDTTLVLGDFTFGATEIPAEIVAGGAHHLAVHELVGGTRIVDAMGRSDDDISWSGLLLGAGAVDRARFLDGLRIDGTEQTLTWDEFNYTVVVAKFDWHFQRFYQIPYSITCKVVTDNVLVVVPAGATPFDEAIDTDLDDANTLAAAVADSQLNTLITNVTNAVGTVKTFVNAPPAVVNGVLGPLLAASNRVGALITTTSSITQNVPGFGGVVAGSTFTSYAPALNAQIAAGLQLDNLYNLRGLLGRMANNLGAAADSEVQLATAGGNLFQIAASEYGDATAWTTIANANGLADPFIQGTEILTIPPTPTDSGGIPSF